MVRLHLPAAQQNSVLLRHTESVNNRLNHKGHPLLYFSSLSNTLTHYAAVIHKEGLCCLIQYVSSFCAYSLSWTNVNLVQSEG